MSALLLALGLGTPEDHSPPAPRSQRQWVVDSALYIAAVGLGTVSLATTVRHGLDGPLLVADALSGAALCIALWWRRRWPVALGLASLPILVVSSSGGLASLMILATIAAYRRWQLVVVIAVAQLALLPVGRVVHTQGNSLLEYYFVGALAIAVAVAWGMLLRGNRRAEEERQRRTRAEQQLHVEQARYAERARIAREMHDVLAHRISLLSLHAGALEFRPDAPPEEIARAAAVIRASAHQALEDLREVIGLLRDDAGGDAPQPPQPTLATLPGLLEESRAAGMRVHDDVRIADLAAVPDAIGRHALRIVQEALTNARKHAPSAAVDLRVAGAPGDGLTIEVRNPVPVPAVGATEIPGSGTGLVGLAERATLSGGHLEHGLDGGGDFRLRAWLPWSQ